jgi:hypothetical protein
MVYILQTTSLSINATGDLDSANNLIDTYTNGGAEKFIDVEVWVTGLDTSQDAVLSFLLQQKTSGGSLLREFGFEKSKRGSLQTACGDVFQGVYCESSQKLELRAKSNNSNDTNISSFARWIDSDYAPVQVDDIVEGVFTNSISANGATLSSLFEIGYAVYTNNYFWNSGTNNITYYRDNGTPLISSHVTTTGSIPL